MRTQREQLFTPTAQMSNSGVIPLATLTPLFLVIPLSDPAGLSSDPAGLSNDPAGLSNDPAGLSSDPAGLSNALAGLSNDPAGLSSDQCICYCCAPLVFFGEKQGGGTTIKKFDSQKKIACGGPEKLHF